MKASSRFLTIIWVIALVVGLTGCGSSLSKTQYTLATGSKSGVYYPIGEALDKILKQTHPNHGFSILETAGSMENIKLLIEGKADLALVQNDIAYYAANGEAMFAGQKMTGLSGIATLFPEIVQIIVRKETGIANLSDLEGKKIAVGSKNSGTYYNAQQILSIAKVWSNIDHQYVGAGEAMQLLQEGKIDGFIFTSGLPNPSIVELAKKVEISLIPIEPDLVQKLVSEYSFYFPSTIAANQYPGQTQELSGVEINAILISASTLSENDQYLLTKALFGQPNDLGKSHPRLSKMTKNSLRQQLPIQLGKGAYKAHSEIP
jgi:TRAP transporter TAXI family solute receptor